MTDVDELAWLDEMPVPAPPYSEWWQCPVCDKHAMHGNYGNVKWDRLLGDHVRAHLVTEATAFLSDK